MAKMPVRGMTNLTLGNSFVFSPFLNILHDHSSELKDPSL